MGLQFPRLLSYWDKEVLNKEKPLRDTGVAIAFVAAIAVLLLVAGYVINRMAGNRAYREKWKDYRDCGWA